MKDTKEYKVTICVERIVEATIRANSGKEAMTKAKVFSNLRDEKVISEKIVGIDSIEEKKQ